MSDVPAGFDNPVWTDPTEAELDNAAPQLHMLAEGADKGEVPISRFAVFYPGVSRRYVRAILDGLVARGVAEERIKTSANGKGRYSVWVEKAQ